MFLIDSSVWIEHLRPKGSAKIKEKVSELLVLGVVVSYAIVVIEIMRGAKNKKDIVTETSRNKTPFYEQRLHATVIVTCLFYRQKDWR